MRGLADRLRRRLTALVLVAIGLGMVAAAWPLLSWAKQVTGEESLFEATKGAVALSTLQLRSGGARQLAPLEPALDKDVRAHGVNAFLQLEADPAVVRRTLDTLAAANIRWVRQEIPWEDLEIHGPGDFEDRRNTPYVSAWEKYDRIVEEARMRGIDLLLRLDNPPDWAFADPAASGEKGPPDDPARFDAFVAAVAERYCGRVKYYQIWNEPNIYPEWGERDVDPAAYAQLLASAARQARSACADIRIVSAALAPTTVPGGRNMDDLAYLEALYAAGWQADFDILAVQGFGLWTGPTDRRASRDRTNFARIELAREIMVAHGDEAKPVWITEMGWTSPPESLTVPDRDKYGRATEEVRARYLAQAYERMAEEWPWAGVGFVWMLRRPDWEWHSRPEGWFRLLEPDWQTTPAFTEMARIATAPPALSWGRHLPTHPALTATGPWQPPLGATATDPGSTAAVRAGSGAIVGTAGAELVFPFRGTGYQLRVVEESAFRAFVVVDGLTGTVTADTEGLVHEGDVGLAEGGLPNGDHTGILRIEDGSLVLEDIVIEAGAPREWWRGAVSGVLSTLAVLVAGGWLLWRMRRRTAAATGGPAD